MLRFWWPSEREPIMIEWLWSRRQKQHDLDACSACGRKRAEHEHADGEAFRPIVLRERPDDFAIPSQGIALASLVLCLDDEVAYDARLGACPRCGRDADRAPSIERTWMQGLGTKEAQRRNRLAAARRR